MRVPITWELAGFPWTRGDQKRWDTRQKIYDSKGRRWSAWVAKTSEGVYWALFSIDIGIFKKSGAEHKAKSVEGAKKAAEAALRGMARAYQS